MMRHEAETPAYLAGRLVSPLRVGVSPTICIAAADAGNSRRLRRRPYWKVMFQVETGSSSPVFHRDRACPTVDRPAARRIPTTSYLRGVLGGRDRERSSRDDPADWFIAGRLNSFCGRPALFGHSNLRGDRRRFNRTLSFPAKSICGIIQYRFLACSILQSSEQLGVRVTSIATCFRPRYARDNPNKRTTGVRISRRRRYDARRRSGRLAAEPSQSRSKSPTPTNRPARKRRRRGR